MPNLTDPGMWNEAYRVLAIGQPPVMVQLLLFNTVMMIMWNLRRARGVWAIRKETAIAIQVILLLGISAVFVAAAFFLTADQGIRKALGARGRAGASPDASGDPRDRRGCANRTRTRPRRTTS